MVTSMRSQFGLFDFFSVFVPGASFLIGLVPFLPKQTPIASIGAAVPLSVGGIVVGRIIYGVSAAAKRESMERDRTVSSRFVLKALGALGNHWLNDTSHRQQFSEQIRSENPSVITTTAADHLYQVAIEEFSNQAGNDSFDVEERTDLSTDQAEYLYTLVRTTIHADGRGWSRTFQAIHTFYRTMWFVSLSLSVVYVFYGMMRLTEAADDLVGYTSFLRASGISDGVIMSIAVAVALGSTVVFSEARQAYREYYLRYLVADFISVHESSTLTATPDSP
jgi:hypothetical protein